MAPRAAARLETLGLGNVHLYSGGKLDWMAAGMPTEGTNSQHPRAAAVARREVPRAALTETLADVRTRVRAAGWDSAAVVNPDDVVLGLLRPADFEKGVELRVEEAMSAGPSTFRPYVPIKEMADYLTAHEVVSAAITTSDGKLVGLLYREDAVRGAADCPDCERKMI